MEELRIIVGKNLASLRKAKKITQIELAEKFNYSDKAVSKWEQGATLPDLEILKSLCDYYGVTLDYLTHEENIDKPQIDNKQEHITFVNRIIMICLLDSMIWLVCVVTFLYPLLFRNNEPGNWTAFVWGVPVSALLVLIMNRIYFRNKICAVACLSTFVWGVLVSVHLQMLVAGAGNVWLIYIIGVPLQVSFILWLLMRKGTKK